MEPERRFDDHKAEHHDRSLVTQAQAGDREALEALVGRHQRWIYNIAIRMLAHPQDAEDATQEILIKAITRLSTFEGRSRFRTWLYRIVVNHVLNARRGRAEPATVGFGCYAHGLDTTPDLDLPDPRTAPADLRLLVDEARISCTSGMLLCLDREQRLVYILGEILAVTDTRNNANTGLAPLTIGLTLAMIHMASIGADGTSVNPARSIGPALFAGGDSIIQLWLFILAPLIMVFAISAGINRMAPSTSQLMFWIFSALMGVSLSSIFLVYTHTSIVRVFFITAASFGALSLYGYTTQKDLSGWGSFLFMGLIGVIIAMLVNLFIGSTALQFAISVIGVLVFAGLTAYDTQQIKEMYYAGDDGTVAGRKAVMGALRLYLDFINLFMLLLQLFGDRR